MADVYIAPGGRPQGKPVSNSDKIIQGPSNPNTPGGVTIGGQGAPTKNTGRNSSKKGK